MIDRKLLPIEWTEFMYELEDAREHLDTLIKNVTQLPDYDEAAFRIDLGHVYAHLNRAWRRSSKGLDDGDWEAASQFPCDLKPIG